MTEKIINLSLILLTVQFLLTGLYAQDEQKAELVVQTGHTSSVESVAFSPDGKILASGSADNTVKLWDIASRQELRTLSGHNESVNSVAFSSDGKTLASGAGKTVKLWDVASGQELRTFSRHTDIVFSVAFSPDRKTLASGSLDETIKLWDVANGQELRTFSGHTNVVFSVAFSPDGKTLASGSWDSTVKLWDVASGQELRTLKGHTGLVKSVTFSPDGKTLASGSYDHTVKLWDVASGQELRTLIGHSFYVESVAFSPDGKTLASGSSWDRTIKLWDVASGQELRTLKGHTGLVKSVTFSPDGKTLASGSYDKTIKLWDVASGELLKTFQRDASETVKEVYAVVPDYYKKSGYEPISADGRFQIKKGENSKLNLIDVKTGRLLASLIALDENDWAVVTPEGLFDASPDGRKLMHYIIGLEPISLEQMKDVYHVPGLLQKIFNEEPLPNVELFSKKDLFPEVEFSQPKTDQQSLDIKLTNRGGGIGQVQVLVNGMEVVEDARSPGFDPDTKQPVTLTVSLKDAPFIDGEENIIEVIARNSEGSLTNRGTPKGSVRVRTAEDIENLEPPNIYAIIAGISDYTGDGLDLRFAAKDAEDFAKAIELGAVNLPKVDKSKVHIRLLTSNGPNADVKFDVPDARISKATKEDFRQAFADFSKATTRDIFIVYLSGHGVSLKNPNRAGGDSYLYLTQEATTTDSSVLSVQKSREAMTLSGDEIKDFMKQNKALKKVLILDTCAAGQVAASLVVKKDLPSDQIRALERFKDNTGFYVLMGSAADAVSYEANQYGQGLLTYSLLQGMKGARLKEDQYADVEMLFGYAAETVPNLARGVGGIQTPRVITPDTSRSFDLGRFTKADQEKIILSTPKPIILRPSLQNEELFNDDLGLTALLGKELRNINNVRTRGESSPIVFVEADAMPDAVKLSGRYTVAGDDLTVKFVLVRNGERIGDLITVTGKTNEKESLVKKIVAEIVKVSAVEIMDNG